MNIEEKTATSVDVDEQFFVINQVELNIVSILEEVPILLGSYPQALLGLYIQLVFLSNRGFLKKWKSLTVATYLNVNTETLKQYLDKLEELGLITQEKTNNTWKRKQIIINNIERLSKTQATRLSKVEGDEHQVRVLHELANQIHPITKEELIEQRKLEQHIQAQMAFETQVQQKATEIVKKKEEKKKKEEQKFPLADYKSVLDGYRKYKGVYIKPNSPDEGRYRKAAKNMFLSGWAVLDILACMRFFSEHSADDDFGWLHNWTLETVGKKMAEFKAGKLKQAEVGDELPNFKDLYQNSKKV